MYYTTPIYQFRMKCTMCDIHYVIKTDPKNLDYEIVSGARRQERRWDSTQNGQVVPDLKETTNRLFDDAMFKLEHGDADKGKKKDAEPRIRDLAEIQGIVLLLSHLGEPYHIPPYFQTVSKMITSLTAYSEMTFA